MKRDKNKKNTIAAIATPPGQGGLALIRISGSNAIEAAGKIFAAKNKKPLLRAKSHTIVYGNIIDIFKSGHLLDEVLLSIMRAPKTYTTEDVVEISCHGGLMTAKVILELLLKLGLRLAEPGEFTKRAFLNGRIDLAQAEAVYDVINSKTDKSLQLAFGHLRGSFSAVIRQLADGIADIISDIEAAVDFDAQHIKTLNKKALKISLRQKVKVMEKMILEADSGIIFSEGISVVICGKANAGKSSLMNAFLKAEKVIVSPIAGTTRDTIEEIVNIKDVALKFIDTAGIIKSGGLLEAKSAEKTVESLKRADLALLMLDASKQITHEDKKIIHLIKDKPYVVALNKTDLKSRINFESVSSIFKGKKIIKISALKRTGLHKLESEILKIVFGGRIKNVDSRMINNLRQKELVKKSLKALKKAHESLSGNLSDEFISFDLRESLNCLLEITGETVNADILERIFSKFCIGK